MTTIYASTYLRYSGIELITLAIVSFVFFAKLLFKFSIRFVHFSVKLFGLFLNLSWFIFFSSLAPELLFRFVQVPFQFFFQLRYLTIILAIQAAKLIDQSFVEV